MKDNAMRVKKSDILRAALGRGVGQSPPSPLPRSITSLQHHAIRVKKSDILRAALGRGVG